MAHGGNSGLNGNGMPASSSSESLFLRRQLRASGQPALPELRSDEEASFSFSQAYAELSSRYSAFGRRAFSPSSMRETWAAVALKLFPCLEWLSQYTVADGRADLFAGVTVACLLIPQGMGYARLAGLAPIYGLYASFVPLYVYAAFGTSRQLSVGPVAIVSLLTKTGLSPVVSPLLDPIMYTKHAIFLTFLIGMIQTSFGILRMGWLVSFLSYPVISGFTGGSAVLICLSQLRNLLGFTPRVTPHVDESVWSHFSGIETFNRVTTCLGLLWLAILLLCKHLSKTYHSLFLVKAAGPFLVLMASSVSCWFFELHSKYGVAITGNVQDGLPPLSIDWIFGSFWDILPTAITCAMVGFMESIAIDKALAAKSGFKPADVDQEMVALGLANFVGSCFSSIPVTGSFSRSAIKADCGACLRVSAGARTGMSGVVVASIIALLLRFLTSAVYFIPANVFGAIIVSACSSLIDFGAAAELWGLHKRDFCLWALSFLGTIFLGVQRGMGLAVVISIGFVIYESARPHTAVLGRLPDSKVYRSVKQYPEATTFRGILIFRVDAAIYFANVSYLKDLLLEHETRANAEAHYCDDLRARRAFEGTDPESQTALLSAEPAPALRFIILEMTPVVSVDSSAVHALRDIVGEYSRRGVQLVLANPNGAVLRVLELAGLPESIGREWLFLRVSDAVEACGIALVAGEASGGGRRASWAGGVGQSPGEGGTLPRPRGGRVEGRGRAAGGGQAWTPLVLKP